MILGRNEVVLLRSPRNPGSILRGVPPRRVGHRDVECAFERGASQADRFPKRQDEVGASVDHMARALAEPLWCYEWIDASEQFEQSGPTGMERIGCVGGGVGRAASFES